MLGLNDLQNKTFIDIGTGSGLFSLAAKCLGAKAFSFDHNLKSIRCTNKFKEIYFQMILIGWLSKEVF
jgi:ribosomal protein L11 methylase PrmA